MRVSTFHSPSPSLTTNHRAGMELSSCMLSRAIVNFIFRSATDRREADLNDATGPPSREKSSVEHSITLRYDRYLEMAEGTRLTHDRGRLERSQIGACANSLVRPRRSKSYGQHSSAVSKTMPSLRAQFSRNSRVQIGAYQLKYLPHPLLHLSAVQGFQSSCMSQQYMAIFEIPEDDAFWSQLRLAAMLRWMKSFN